MEINYIDNTLLMLFQIHNPLTIILILTGKKESFVIKFYQYFPNKIFNKWPSYSKQGVKKTRLSSPGSNLSWESK